MFQGMLSSHSDAEHNVIIGKLLDSIFNACENLKQIRLLKVGYLMKLSILRQYSVG
jgi:hypothetical protein